MEDLKARDPPLKARSLSFFSPTLFAVAVLTLTLLVIVRVAGQNPAVPLTVLSKEGRRTIPLTTANAQEFVGLDDLASAFQLTVREESGAITVSYKGKTIVQTPDQPLASVSGRLVSLPAAPLRAGNRWSVPVEFISRALGLIYDSRLDLRRASHLLIVGDMRVPRVSIRLEPLANATRVTIDATPRTASAIAQETGRLTIKFDADAIDAAIPAFQPQGFVQAIRTIESGTLGFELGPRFAAARTSTEDIEDTTRTVIDLVGADTSTTTAAAPALPTPTPSELPVLGQPATAIRTIAVDAGHGGDDEGAQGAEGTREKDLTLAVARRLKGAIEGRLGIRVLLTRDDDRRVPLDERSAIANNSKVDLFISLHANASVRPTPEGASIHVATFDGAEVARTLTPERVQTFGGVMRDIELVQWDLAQIRYVDQSTAMARLLQEQFQGRVPLDNQPIDAGPFRVLESANMPAVLVEMGYLTNPDQERNLARVEFQNTLVQAIVDAIVKFREYLERTTEVDR